MASLCLNSIPFPPPSHPRKLTETSSSSSSSLLLDGSNHSASGALKPIVVSGNPPTFVSAPGRRIVAVGDLHGDFRQTRSALEMAGVLSSDGQNLWTGGETVLIQLGDILDRGEEEIAILSLLRSLDIQARAKGGAVFQVNGNHETMNVEGDFRYVESGGFDECSDFLEYTNDSEDDWEENLAGWVDVSERWKEDQKMADSYWGPWNLVKKQKGVIARSILFRPGGSLACELARHPVVLKVNDWVFCHGGLLPHHVVYGLERMNKEVSEWMRGLNENDDGPKIPFIATRGYDSVVWNRLYSRDTSDLVDYKTKQAPPKGGKEELLDSGSNDSDASLRKKTSPKKCIPPIESKVKEPDDTNGYEKSRKQVYSILEETLQAVDARAMVVGHTPQTMGVNCKYNCSIWRVDVGMSNGVLNSRPEVLEIRDNEVRVIRSNRDKHRELQAVEYI